MVSSPALRSAPLPARHPGGERETFLHIALLGITLTVAALLAYIVVREAEDLLETADRGLR